MQDAARFTPLPKIWTSALSNSDVTRFFILGRALTAPADAFHAAASFFPAVSAPLCIWEPGEDPQALLFVTACSPSCPKHRRGQERGSRGQQSHLLYPYGPPKAVSCVVTGLGGSEAASKVRSVDERSENNNGDGRNPLRR